MTTLEILASYSTAFPDRIAVKTLGDAYSYKAINDIKERWVGWLSHNHSGSRHAIAIMASSTCEYLGLFLAAWQNRVPIIPLDPSLKDEEINKILKLTSPAIRLIQKGLRTDNLASFNFSVMEEALDLNQLIGPNPGAQVYPKDIAVVYTTSGSTGEPKGVMISYPALEARSNLIATDDGIRPDDRILCPIPLTNSYAMDLVLPSLRRGAFIFLFEPWLANPSSIFRMIEKEKITVSTAVPFFYRLSLKVPASFKFDLSSVRIFHTGSSALNEEVAKEFYKRFGHYIRQGYGLVEAGFAVFNQSLNPDTFLSSIGSILPGLKYEIASDGELILMGPTLFSGYLNNPVETVKFLKNEKLYTHDLVKADEAGNLWFEGRSDSRINISGVKVQPEEIERIAMKYSLIKHAVVTTGVDDITGEVPILNVVMEKFPESDSDKKDAAKEIQIFLKNELMDMKCPREIRFYRDFPLSPLSKILKHQIGSPE